MSLPPQAQGSIPGGVASPLAGAGFSPAGSARLSWRTEDAVQHPHHGALQDFILHRRDPQWPLPAIGFRDVHPTRSFQLPTFLLFLLNCWFFLQSVLNDEIQVADAKSPAAWVDREVSDCEFRDERLGKRLRSLLEQLSSSPGDSIPLVCQDWASTKTAYRFLDNDRVSEAEILGGHFQATRDRASATDGQILVMHDTTEFTYKREDIEAIGKTRINIAGAYRDGTPRYLTACGILMHSSLAVTTDGLPLGLAAIKFWSRKKFKGTNALKKRINPTRVPIEEKESIRWLDNLKQATNLLGDVARCLHIDDLESDIYELFCAAEDAGTKFLLRTCVDRLAGDGEHTIATEMAEVDCKGLHRIEVRDRHGNISEATLELRFRRILVQPPLYKQGRYPALELTVLHVTERGKPSGRDLIDWKLITNLPATSRAQAIEKLQWYALRWKIETFHKILKSGCQAEQSKLRTAERLVSSFLRRSLKGVRLYSAR